MKKETRKKRADINGLSEIEAEVMQNIWGKKKVTVREVHETMMEKGYIPYTTIMAVMNNLALKGLLKQNRNGKAYLYSAAVSKNDMANALIDNVVDKILGGSAVPVLRHLLKFKTEAEVEELLALKKKLRS